MKDKDLINVRHIISTLPSIPKTGIEKSLLFYRAAVELERYKAAHSERFYPYTLYIAQPDSILIDIPCNREFHRDFVTNVKTGTFHGSLAVTLAISSKDVEFKLLELCRPFDNVKQIDIDRQLFACNVSDFTVNLKEAEKMTLPAGTISEIEQEISNARSFYDVEDTIKKFFGQEASISDTIYLSLRSEDNILSSTISELKKITASQLQTNELLSLFLQPHSFENQIENVDVATLLTVSDLDESQRKAIAKALGQKLTVVTGPPGTGKTQLIVNLIANGLVRGMSMLLASKNNRAVDNVKERFDLIDNYGYMLRFGSRDKIGTITIPELERFQNLAESEGVKLSDEYTSALDNYFQACRNIADCTNKFARILYLSQIIDTKSAQLAQIKAELDTAEREYSEAKETLMSKWQKYSRLSMYTKDKCDAFRRDLLRLRNNLFSRYTGAFKFWNNLFSKKKDAARFIELVESLSAQVKDAVVPEEWENRIEAYHSGDDIVKQSDLILSNLKSVEQFFRELSQLEHSHGLKCTVLKKQVKDSSSDLTKFQQKLGLLQLEEPNIKRLYTKSKSFIDSCSSNLVNAAICKCLSSKGAKVAIAQYKQYLPNVPWKQEEIKRFSERTANMLRTLQINATTSLSVKTAFPLQNQLFDMLIIDEASQCDLASALPMILRAKRVVIIGDPLQLKHISQVRAYEEEEIAKSLGLSLSTVSPYGRQSLWDHAAEVLAFANSGNAIVNLDNHYRCHPDIIRFSNESFYMPRTGINLAIKTAPSHPELAKQGIVLYPVVGIQKSEDENCNEAEANECIRIAASLRQKYPRMTIGIVTPFRHQANLINVLMPDNLRDDIVADTVNRYQGDERDIMIYSLMVTDNSPKRKLRWIDDKNEPNLINVAITRAKNLLIIVGNIEYVRQNSPKGFPLGDLLRYAVKK